MADIAQPRGFRHEFWQGRLGPALDLIMGGAAVAR